MQNAAPRQRCEAGPSRQFWSSIPLDLIVSGIAILAAAGLKLAGVFP